MQFAKKEAVQVHALAFLNIKAILTRVADLSVPKTLIVIDLKLVSIKNVEILVQEFVETMLNVT